MNCQDISRIANSGRIGKLDETERRAAEAHVVTCRSCAAVWGAQARLAELPIPPMPAELRLRCRSLFTQSAQSRNSRGLRHLVLVGSLLGVAAAAGILLLRARDSSAPASGPSAPTTLARATPDSATTVQLGGDATAGANAAPVQAEETTTPKASLPQLPMPEQQDERAVEDLALQKLVQRHPELVEGPDLEGMSSFLASMAMRSGGEVISSAVRIPTGINGYELDHELYRTLPTDAGNTLIAQRQKHTKVPDGRSLRGNLNFTIRVLPDGYNTSRSTIRVRDIVGNRYNHLLLPSAGGVLNRLTILLASDGTILKESVELERQAITFRETRADDPQDVARVAEDRARRLGVEVDQIGLMGSTSIEDGTIKLVDNGTPGGFVDDKRRELVISYAWQRGSGESSPTLRQNGPTKPAVNLASALAIVEQQIPYAFTAKPVGAEGFMVVMSADGGYIRAGRISMYGTPDMMARQLVPGVRTTAFTNLRLTNQAGAQADVYFVWELPGAGMTKGAD